MGSQNAHVGAHSLSPSPTITKHRTHISPVHAEDILGSITSGAHYSGALPGRHSDEAPLHPKAWRRRSLNLNVDDANVRLLFKDVISDLEQLYAGKPSLEIVRRRWREDASLEHPLFRCGNLHEITRLLFAIPRLVKTAEHVSTRILSAGSSPNRLIYAQTYVYTLRLFGTRRQIKSIVFVDLDEDMKIAHLIDQWNGEESSSWWGAASFRRLFAKIISWTTRVPKHRS
ncbi:hypothetical protein C2E23DRAFT_819151 [Lenzites betulinus]|nr:hypothetical protein C2E23DRAFT_819151 [Lenzites betulinus]